MSEQQLITSSWHTYPSIYALGHKALSALLTGPVVVEEKVDGSQFSFGRFGGELKCRSKNCNIYLDAPEKMFKKAVEYVVSIQDQLHDGWTYRAEYLKEPKHNALTYDHVPMNHLIVFDINTGHEEYLPYAEKVAESARLRLETVPMLFEGEFDAYSRLEKFLEHTSVLGLAKIEGVVVKNYSQFGRDKKVLMGKFVSEAFKEIHQTEWKKQNTNHNDILLKFELKYRTQARWQKAVQHLKEQGLLVGEPKDIGFLVKEVGADIFKECEDEILADLKSWAMPQIRRLSVRGLPEWYKQELAKGQFAV